MDTLTQADRQFIARVALAQANQMFWALCTSQDQAQAWCGPLGMYKALEAQLLAMCEASDAATAPRCECGKLEGQHRGGECYPDTFPGVYRFMPAAGGAR